MAAAGGVEGAKVANEFLKQLFPIDTIVTESFASIKAKEDDTETEFKALIDKWELLMELYSRMGAQQELQFYANPADPSKTLIRIANHGADVPVASAAAGAAAVPYILLMTSSREQVQVRIRHIRTGCDQLWGKQDTDHYCWTLLLCCPCICPNSFSRLAEFEGRYKYLKAWQSELQIPVPNNA